MAKFGDIGEFRTGGTPSSSHPEYYGTEYPWITTVALGSTYIDSSDATAFLSNEGLTNSSTKVIDAGSLMIGIRVGVGKCSINNVPMCTSQDIVSVVGIDKKKYYLPFLVAFVNSKKDYFDTQKRGATIKGITTALIKDLVIPDLSYEKQKEIASVLEGLQLLIEQHGDMLALIDQLVKSRFIEMFGDPVRNDKGWPLAPLASLAEIKIGPFGSLLHKEDYVHGGHALVNPSHIIDGQIVTDNDLTVSEAKYAEMGAYHLRRGDIVLGRRGEMGRCAVVYNDGLLCGTGSLIIRPAAEMLPYFLQKIISYPTFKESIEDMAVGVTMMNLNVPIVSNFMIPLLPLEEQSAYLRFVEQTDKSKFSLKNGGKDADFAVKCIWESLCRGTLT